jgi:hypothetical protein
MRKNNWTTYGITGYYFLTPSMFLMIPSGWSGEMMTVAKMRNAGKQSVFISKYFLLRIRNGKIKPVLYLPALRNLSNGEFIMAIVTHTHRAGKDLTPEEHEAARLRLEEAAKWPYVYDPDCPLLTPEQLGEFRPAYFATMEERDQAMRAMGIVDPEEEELRGDPRPKLEKVSGGSR